jgi:hypothetical protein
MTGVGRKISLRAALIAAAVSSVTLSACVEDPLSLDAGSAPGASSPTLDFTIVSSDLPSWRDTAYSGFALPSEAAFNLVSNTPDMASRLLALLNVPDTIRTFADTLPVDRFDSVSVRVVIDTVGSRFTTLPVTVRMVALTRGFSEDSATWSQAASGVPWTTPGGDLGIELGSAILSEVSDSVRIEIAVDQDSLMKSWQDSDGEPGFAFLVDGGEALLEVRNVVVRYDALLEGREVPVSRTQSLTENTFIVSPEMPPIGLGIRLGDTPASRFYLELRVPASVDGVPLEGSTINHAEIAFTPLGPPSAPYELERDLQIRTIRLLADPFVYGPKTPIGAGTLTLQTLDPDSLAAGRPLRVDMTRRVREAIASGQGLIRMGLRADPDGQTLGFWEFASVDAALGLRPRLRIVLTPPPDFQVPN